MPRNGTIPWNAFERWAATALVLAALARFGTDAIHHLVLAGYLTAPPVWVSGVLTNLTYVAAMIGLLGISPRVADGSPRLVQGGLVAIGIVFASVVAANIGRIFFGPPDGPTIVVLVVSISFYAFTTIAFLLFGAASVRTPSLSRAVGVPLLVVALSRVLTLVGGILDTLMVMYISTTLFVLPLLTVAYLLWTGSIPARTPEASPTA